MKIMLPANYKRLSRAERKEVRQAYIEKQKGLCYFCHGPLNKKPDKEVTEKRIDWDLFPDGFLKNPVHLHHSHETGLTLGAVHAYCNAVLWQYYGE